MGPRRVVVFSPLGLDRSGVIETEEQRLVQQLGAHPVVVMDDAQGPPGIDPRLDHDRRARVPVARRRARRLRTVAGYTGHLGIVGLRLFL